MQAKETFTCSICSLRSSGGKHNPHPIYDIHTGYACGTCNNEVVLPTRALIRKRRTKVAAMLARAAENKLDNDQRR